jgi:acyl-ACP thioesterase
VYTDSRKVRLGDVDRRGRLRLDSTARYLQDVATDDASDADLDRRYGWLVRRTSIETTESPVLGEQVEIATWCTGIGRSWAERRTSIVGGRGSMIDSVSLWIQIDLESGRPTRVGDDFRVPYRESAAGRTVSSRLSIPGPDGSETLSPWTVRRTDIDPFDHVNNAANWAFLEEVAELDTAESRRGRAEMEYLQPVVVGDGVEVAAASPGEPGRYYLVRGTDVLSAARWTPA